MARTFAEETVETSNTTGTGSYSLEGAEGAYLPFSASFSTGDKPAYVVRNARNTKWEMNRGGAYTAGSPATLARNVWKSTNSNAAVPWTADDLPLTIYIPGSAELHEGVVTGWLNAARHALVRAGALFWTYSDIAVKWDRYLATGDATQTHVGTLDVVKGLYFDDGRRPWTAVGAANKTISAADINGIFTQNNSAASRTFTLPASNAAGVGEGFKVGGLGLTAGGQYGIVLTPGANDGIDGGADGVAKTIPGGVRFDVEWDQASDTWRVTYLNTQQSFNALRRQTVAAGPVDSNGLPSGLPSTNGTLAITWTIAASSRFVATAANGWDYQGRQADRVGVSLSNLAWSGLTASRAAATPNYLYVTVNADGTLTAASTILAPVYQWGGTPAVTAGQFTFNIAEMKGYLGNGTTAPQAFVVFVGEAATDGTGVISTVMYAYNGRYEGAFTSTLWSASTGVSRSHNIGVVPRVKDFILECTTIDNSFAVGEQISMAQQTATSAANGVYHPHPLAATRNSMRTFAGPYTAFVATDVASGSNVALTAGSWKYKPIADRGW